MPSETAWTEQGPGVHRVEPRAPEAVRAALAEALAVLRPAAVKIGMAVGPATAAAHRRGPGRLRRVRWSSIRCWRPRAGGPCGPGTPRELLPLLRRATLVTPNAVEAADAGRSRTSAGDDRRGGGDRPLADRSRAAGRRPGQRRAPRSDLGDGTPTSSTSW